jgi:hypothetical protein
VEEEECRCGEEATTIVLYLQRTDSPSPHECSKLKQGIPPLGGRGRQEWRRAHISR